MKKKAKKAKAKAKPKKAKAKKVVRAKVKAKKAKKATPKAKAKKKTAGKKQKLSVIPPANSVLLGRVEDYFAHIGVIALTLLKPVHTGDHLHILGHTTNLEQTLDSMQINHQSVAAAGVKAEVGIKITSRARPGDYVFLIRG